MRMRSQSVPPIVSPSVKTFLQQSCQKLIGIGLLVVAAIGIAMLVSYSPADSSLNTISTSRDFTNIFGQAGAHVASFLVNTFGVVAGFALVIVPALWGMRLWRNTWRGGMRGVWLRLVLLLPVLCLLAASSRALFGQGAMAGAVGEIIHILIATTPLLNQGLAGDLPITMQLVATGVMMLAGIIGYIYVATIGTGEVRVVAMVLRLAHKVSYYLVAGGMVLLRLTRRLLTDSSGGVKPNTRTNTRVFTSGHRPRPARRREPIITESSDTYGESYGESPRQSPHQSPNESHSESYGESSPESSSESYGHGYGESPHDQHHAQSPTQSYTQPPPHSQTHPHPGPTQSPAHAPRPRPRPIRHQPSLRLPTPEGYTLPPSQFLAPPTPYSPVDATSLDNTSRMLESVLAEFGVGGHIEKARFGPVVTRYEFMPAPGIKTQRVIALAEDIARSMSALSVRVAVTPGQNTIGIELPNSDRGEVLLRHILDHGNWTETHANLPLALGVDITGLPLVVDLASMPHLLVAGTTGSGKSVGLNAMILSLLYTHTPDACRLIMIDPKMLEFSVYDGIPHLLTPVVTDRIKAVAVLKWAVREMEARYRHMAEIGVRNIDGFNKAVVAARKKGTPLTQEIAPEIAQEIDSDHAHDPIQALHDINTNPSDTHELSPLPSLVIVIDEVADLMQQAGKEVEAVVQRLAQMARAAGIHVIMATQRPSVDVITGTIKANFPTRISFQVTSRIDSRTILGEQGAESLLGQGDMLYMEGGGRITRVHGAFVSEDEVEKVASFLREQGEGVPLYDDSIMAELAAAADADARRDDGGGRRDGAGAGDNDADLYQQALDIIRRHDKVSISFIQRHLRIGYNRAATIIEEMEHNGVISPPDHAGKRNFLLPRE